MERWKTLGVVAAIIAVTALLFSTCSCNSKPYMKVERTVLFDNPVIVMDLKEISGPFSEVFYEVQLYDGRSTLWYNIKKEDYVRLKKGDTLAVNTFKLEYYYKCD